MTNGKLTNEKIMFISNKISSSGRHFGCRLAIKNEFIFATLGDRGAREDSQNSKNHSGSIIKIFNLNKTSNDIIVKFKVFFTSHNNI